MTIADEWSRAWLRDEKLKRKHNGIYTKEQGVKRLQAGAPPRLLGGCSAVAGVERHGRAGGAACAVMRWCVVIVAAVVAGVAVVLVAAAAAGVVVVRVGPRVAVDGAVVGVVVRAAAAGWRMAAAVWFAHWS
jgi:hypothetical protein